MNRSVAANKEQVIFKQLFYIILLIVPLLDLLLMIKVMKYFVKHGELCFYPIVDTDTFFFSFGIIMNLIYWIDRVDIV